jgi:hypothetical protein
VREAIRVDRPVQMVDQDAPLGVGKGDGQRQVSLSQLLG